MQRITEERHLELAEIYTARAAREEGSLKETYSSLSAWHHKLATK